MKKYDAFISGYICIDLIPDFHHNESVTALKEILQPGKLTEINGMGYFPGGVVANTGLAMKKFGQRVFLNGLSGDDFIGKMIREWLTKYALGDGICVTNEAGSAFGLVIAPPGTDRIFLESPGCSKMFDIKHINMNEVAETRLFHFGYPPLLKKFFANKGTQLIKLFREVKKLGVITSLDFSLPDPESESARVSWAEILQDLFPATDIFVPSLEEALFIVDPERYHRTKIMAGDGDILNFIPVHTVRALAKHIIDAGVKIVLIKAGHRGAYLLTGDVSSLNGSNLSLEPGQWNHREVWCPAYPTDESRIKNSSGAGDTAVAGFLSAILTGECPFNALKYAMLAGRNNLYCDDIFREISSWEEMTLEMEAKPHQLINPALGEHEKSLFS